MYEFSQETLQMPFDKKLHIKSLNYIYYRGMYFLYCKLDDLRDELVEKNVTDDYEPVLQELDLLYRMHNSEVKHYIDKAESYEETGLYCIETSLFQYENKEQILMKKIEDMLDAVEKPAPAPIPVAPISHSENYSNYNDNNRRDSPYVNKYNRQPNPFGQMMSIIFFFILGSLLMYGCAFAVAAGS